MTLSAEEKDLKKITVDFEKAIRAFRKKDYQQSLVMFDAIVDTFKNSEYDSVLEIQAQSKIYKNISHSCLNPLKLVLKSEEDHLNEGLFQLNAGNLDQALEFFQDLEEKKGYNDPYLYYLMALAFAKKSDMEPAMKYLKKCISKDDSYKIIAHNEPDFEPISKNEEFLSVVG